MGFTCNSYSYQVNYRFLTFIYIRKDVNLILVNTLLEDPVGEALCKILGWNFGGLSFFIRRNTLSSNLSRDSKVVGKGGAYRHKVHLMRFPYRGALD